MHSDPVIIIGGGLAGLCCARRLDQSQIPWLILEASDRLGGRVRTESFDGFQLDAGFQVLLTSYPEAIRTLNYKALRLGRFQPGALIRHGGKFCRFADPWRVPKAAMATALSPVGTLGDKLRIGKLRASLGRGELDTLLNQPETSTLQRLQRLGFSESMVEGFFRPFFRGVFLESGLSTSSRKFDYLFRLFSSGHAALPAGGMEQIVRQLASPLSSDRIRRETPVKSLAESTVVLRSGQQLRASRVVVACDPWNAARLLGHDLPKRGHPSAVAYFAAERSPIEEPMLILNSDESGPINSFCVPSQVAADYAAPGQSLISVSVQVRASEEQSPVCPDTQAILSQLSGWFGAQVDQWRHLKTILVENALPVQNQLLPSRFARTTQHPNESSDSGPIVCGDYTDIASIQGAMLSGRLAGDSLVQQLSAS